MTKSLLFSFTVLFSSIGFAQSNDLTLPGEKWLAKFDKFVCSDAGEPVARPDALERLQVQFEQVTTDSTLDNALLKATFVAGGQTCRYSAILFADNSAKTTQLVESLAYSTTGANSECTAGKELLDAALKFGPYLYYGHPHNLAIMMPNVGAQEVCGGNELVGANFVVKGLVNP